ncbi:MAG: DoxX family protein [Polyangiaceae bacterium]|nr:DoxX family protein [Polyangiaceae bacterium]
MRDKLLYWVPTGLVVMLMASGGIIDAMGADSALEVMRKLGYPDYFTTLLGVAKILGVVALLAPVPRSVREWAYAGFTFDVVGAVVSILSIGAPITAVTIPFLALVMVQLSYWMWRRRSVSAERPLVLPVAQPA